MAKKSYKTFRVEIEYKVETGEEGAYEPKLSDEKINWAEICKMDPEIVKARVKVTEVK